MDIEKLCSSFDFSGQTLVISGGAGVLGGEMACALVRSGANVAILDRDLSRTGPLRERLEKGSGCGEFVQADVLEKESLLEAMIDVEKRFGKVYGLINAAGGNDPQATTGTAAFFDLPPDAVKHVIRLNLVGTILTSQVFGRAMADVGEGVIINISSMAAYRPLTRTIAYSASKAAVSNFTHWLAVHMATEYSPRIRVNAIAPGFFHTTQNHYLLYDEKDGSLTPRGQTIIDHTPMKRFGNPDDLLGVLFWLLSPGAEFVTGAVIPVDGGFSAFSGV